MKYDKWRFIKGRMCEFYFQLNFNAFTLGITLFDIDFEFHIHLFNCRGDIKNEH